MSTTNTSTMTDTSTMNDNSTMTIDKKELDIFLSAADILKRYRVKCTNRRGDRTYFQFVYKERERVIIDYCSQIAIKFLSRYPNYLYLMEEVYASIIV